MTTQVGGGSTSPFSNSYGAAADSRSPNAQSSDQPTTDSLVQIAVITYPNNGVATDRRYIGAVLNRLPHGPGKKTWVSTATKKVCSQEGYFKDGELFSGKAIFWDIDTGSSSIVKRYVTYHDNGTTYGCFGACWGWL